MVVRDALDDLRRALSLRFLAALSILSFAGAAIQYLQLTIGRESVFYDARVIWRPLAQEVFGGAALYVDVWDNKPPLFHFLNLGIAATDAYIPVFLVAIGLANLTTAALIVVLCEREGYPRVGRLAAVLFLAMCLALPGYQINPRQFANVGVLVALITVRPALAGGAVAAAGLFSQFSVLAIPVICWRRWRSRDGLRRDARWYLVFVAAGLVTAAVAYLAVAVVWGSDAMAAAAENSLFALSGYAEKKAEHSLWTNPIGWTKGTVRQLDSFAVSVVIAAYGAWVSAAPLARRSLPSRTPFRTDGDGRAMRSRALFRHMTVLIALLSLQSMIRIGSGIYILAYAPFVAILAAFGALKIADAAGDG